MQSIETLASLRNEWNELAVRRLAIGVQTRENALILTNRFFDLLLRALEENQPEGFDPLLKEWALSLTQTDLESADSRLISLVRELNSITFETAARHLPESQTLALTQKLIACFNDLFSHAARLEMEAKINYLTRQLEQATQALEKLDRSKSDFIAVAAHELKTPLTLIDGYATMLRENLEQMGLPPYQKVLVEGVQNGTRRLRSIIDDMIDVSLIDNNLLSLNFQPVWMNRLLSVLVSEFSINLKERDQILEIRHFPGYDEMTFGDPDRLLQVLRNLLSNAMKYTPDGGKITVDGRKLPGFVEITIHDTGIGIKAEDVQAIFEKFSRLGDSSLHSSGKTKFKGGGPGLGLRIAKGIVDAHRGTLWVESPGYNEFTYPGSTFHILLPLYSEPPNTQTAKLFAPMLHHSKNQEAKP